MYIPPSDSSGLEQYVGGKPMPKVVEMPFLHLAKISGRLELLSRPSDSLEQLFFRMIDPLTQVGGLCYCLANYIIIK